MEINKIVTDKLLSAIKESGFTQTEIANRLGVSQPTLSMNFKNGSLLTVDRIYKIAEILNINPIDLLVSGIKPKFIFRDVQFRAKSLQNNEFVFGFFHKGRNGVMSIMPEKGQKVKVYSDTIGEFTGLKDHNGIGIYEGDILEWDLMLPEVWIVKYDSAKFVVTTSSGKYFNDLTNLFNRDDNSKVKVIGNVSSNPEFLK